MPQQARMSGYSSNLSKASTHFLSLNDYLALSWGPWVWPSQISGIKPCYSHIANAIWTWQLLRLVKGQYAMALLYRLITFTGDFVGHKPSEQMEMQVWRQESRKSASAGVAQAVQQLGKESDVDNTQYRHIRSCLPSTSGADLRKIVLFRRNWHLQFCLLILKGLNVFPDFVWCVSTKLFGSKGTTKPRSLEHIV